MFVCLGFGHFILFVCFFPWPRSSKGTRMGRHFGQECDFPIKIYITLGINSLEKWSNF